MSHAWCAALLGGVLLSACHDEPIAPVPTTVPAAATPLRAASVFPACTRRWKNPVSGLWGAGANWIPAGVPTAADIVCLDAVGNYTVTVARAASANAVVVGGGTGTTATLRLDLPLPGGGPNPKFTAPLGIEIGTGSTLVLAPSQNLEVGYLLNRGVVRHESGGLPLSVTVRADSLENQGTLRIGNVPFLGFVVSAARGFRNAGTITIDTAYVLLLGGEALLTGGNMAGSGALVAVSAQVQWSGGDIPAHTIGDSRLIVYGGAISLLNPRLTGSVDVGTAYPLPVLSGLPTEVRGDVPSGVTLVLLGDGVHTLTPLSGGVVRSRGIVRLAGVTGSFEATGPGLLNEGTLELLRGGATAEMGFDSLVNTGSVTLAGHARFGTPGDMLRNRGTITVPGGGLLDMAGATFASEAGGVQTGAVSLSNGSILSGAGSVGDVTVADGQVEPGGQARLGVFGGIDILSAASLTLGAGSSVGIDLAGAAAGRHDLLSVTGQLLLAGTLNVREVFPYLGGHCGEVLSVLANGPSPIARGRFSVVTGLLPAADRGWRTDMPPNGLQLVGHDPSQALSLSLDSVGVTEGGPAADYAVCLRSAPTAAVTVAPTSAGGQLLATAPLTISVVGWSLPQYLPVTAVDDAVTEAPPQLAVVTHRVTSTDPSYSGARLGSVDVTLVDNDGTTSLELNILNPPPVVGAGASFTLSLRVLNAGPDVSQDATFTVPANPAFDFLSSSGTLGCATDPTTGTHCVLPTAGAGVNTDFTLTFKALTPGTYPTTVSLTAPQNDPLPGNNSRTQTITIN